ncbi:hypothetical protein C2S51_018968 [Perilla frutescens var. frutescens]|nr:hypothetical protein C2S51_018968 [Perilla frutescens var. frutescens]
MNHPFTATPTLSEIMDSMIHKIQYGVPTAAPLPFAEPSNSSSTSIEFNHLPPTEELLPRLAMMTTEPQVQSPLPDLRQFMPTDEASNWLPSPPREQPYPSPFEGGSTASGGSIEDHRNCSRREASASGGSLGSCLKKSQR